jgi:hypothetical protein
VRATLDTIVAPDLALIDTRGGSFRLSDYRGRKHVGLAFTRGLR